MNITPMVAAAAAATLVLSLGSASGASAQPHLASFTDEECWSLDSPIDDAATLCLQLDDEVGYLARWRLQNRTDWVLDLDSAGTWHEEILTVPSPSLDDLSFYFTRLWIEDQGSDALAIQPDESVYLPAYLTADRTAYRLPVGELRFNEIATAGMISVTSALASADRVATDRSKLYKIVKRMKACATAGAGALLATEQTDEAYAVVLANLTAYSACENYFNGVAKQSKVKLSPTWRTVAVEFSDNFFIQARNAAVKLLQFAR